MKRESDFIIQVAMPSHDLFFRSVGVGDGFIVNSVLAYRGPWLVSSWLYLRQNAAHRGATDIEAAGDLGFADAGTV